MFFNLSVKHIHTFFALTALTFPSPRGLSPCSSPFTTLIDHLRSLVVSPLCDDGADCNGELILDKNI